MSKRKKKKKHAIKKKLRNISDKKISIQNNKMYGAENTKRN